MLMERFWDAESGSRLAALQEPTLALLTTGSTLLDAPSGGVLAAVG
jgi:hypothetical protein